jgi:ubiquinol-cytochrome c reductase cytochrome c subunit
MKLLCIALLFACAAWTQDAEAGKQAFEKYGCYTCHGHLGQGTAAGPRLAPNPIPEAALMAYVRKPGGSMPPYTAKVLSDQELRSIRAFLASVPAPPPVKDIPALNE